MYNYRVDFEYFLEGHEEGIIASSTIEIEREPKTQEEFDTISREIFKNIDGCNKLRLLKVYEDSDLVKNIHDAIAAKADNDQPYRI